MARRPSPATVAPASPLRLVPLSPIPCGAPPHAPRVCERGARNSVHVTQPSGGTTSYVHVFTYHRHAVTPRGTQHRRSPAPSLLSFFLVRWARCSRARTFHVMKLTLLAMVTFGLNTMAEAAASTVDTFAEVVAECATVTVGSADVHSPTKVIKFASTTLNCPSTVSKINWVNDAKWDSYNDEFKIAQTKDAIFVTRTDEFGFGHWGVDLKIKCCPNIPRSNIAPPPCLVALTKDECEAEEVNGRPCEYSEYEAYDLAASKYVTKSTCTDTTLCETVANGFEFTGAKGCCINSMDVNHLSSMPKSFLIDFVKEYPREMCRKGGACGSMGGMFCKGPPSQAPTAAPSNAPTISPLDVCKADLAGARAELASSKTCTPSDRGSLAESCDVMNCRDWTCNGPGVENWCTCFTEEAEKLKIFELLGCGQDGSTCRCET